MIITEAEAREKWCPLARRFSFETTGSTTFATSSNRSSVGGTDKSHCIASLCMMFRWSGDAKISLGNGMTVVVDVEDRDLALDCWWAGRYAKNQDDYLHRLVAMRHYGEIPEGKVVDHIDGNPLNNRSGNLRIVTQSDNVANADGRGQSKYRGVFRDINGKWVAQISKNGQREHLGTFDTEIEAAIAYDNRAVELRGENARLNIRVPNSNSGGRGYCGIAGRPEPQT